MSRFCKVIGLIFLVIGLCNWPVLIVKFSPHKLRYSVLIDSAPTATIRFEQGFLTRNKPYALAPPCSAIVHFQRSKGQADPEVLVSYVKT